MSYGCHLEALISALLRARPDMSRVALSREAGLGRDWVSRTSSAPRTTLANAEQFIQAAIRLCPIGPEGDEVRQLIKALDPAPKTQGDAA